MKRFLAALISGVLLGVSSTVIAQSSLDAERFADGKTLTINFTPPNIFMAEIEFKPKVAGTNKRAEGQRVQVGVPVPPNVACRDWLRDSYEAAVAAAGGTTVR